MVKEFFTAVLALVAQVSGIVSVLAIIAFFLGAPDAVTILTISFPLFLVAFLIVIKLKNGWLWLFSLFLP